MLTLFIEMRWRSEETYPRTPKEKNPQTSKKVSGGRFDDLQKSQFVTYQYQQ